MVWMFRNLRGRMAPSIRTGTSLFSSSAWAASARTQFDLVEFGDQTTRTARAVAIASSIRFCCKVCRGRLIG